MSENGNGAERIGVYICHCGTNIAGTVDVHALAEYASGLPGVVVAREYKYMCSDPGQELIKEDIRDHELTRIVVAACSPCLHEKTFRNATSEGGLNPFFFQMVNIREHNSWVHEDKEAATDKGRALIRAAVRRVQLSRRRSPSPTPASRSTSWSARRRSAATWPSSTRRSPRSTAPPASSPRR
jgi:heterodisulfide reductase subunit A